MRQLTQSLTICHGNVSSSLDNILTLFQNLKERTFKSMHINLLFTSKGTDAFSWMRQSTQSLTICHGNASSSLDNFLTQFQNLKERIFKSLYISLLLTWKRTGLTFLKVMMVHSNLYHLMQRNGWQIMQLTEWIWTLNCSFISHKRQNFVTQNVVHELDTSTSYEAQIIN